MSAVDDFLRKVLKSGLLNREQLQSTLRSLPKDRRDQVPAISNHLIEHGKLTRFQAFKLAQGITLGLIVGPYQILTPLGRGGMGSVYLALDSRNQQYVALKILPPKVAREEERLLARFQREMELSQKIQHPHLARTFEAGVFHNIHYIAMEYIPGQTLYRMVTSQGKLSVARAAHLFSEVATALDHAHRQGVIHRDMKPSNIMVTPHDHAKVLDLGLAYRQGEPLDDVDVVGGRGYIVGSIDYMAPEQTRDPTTVDARADLYALGCCLYFALTGQPPFPEETLAAKVKAHRHQTPAPVREKNDQVPAAFVAVVDRLLAKSPADRFASAAELVAALTPWRGDGQQPLETPGDAAFQDAVKRVIEGWVPIEPAKEAVVDAVLFQAEPEEKPNPADAVSRTIFEEIDRVHLHIWLLLIVLVWVGLLLLTCVVGSCVFSLIQ